MWINRVKQGSRSNEKPAITLYSKCEFKRTVTDIFLDVQNNFYRILSWNDPLRNKFVYHVAHVIYFTGFDVLKKVDNTNSTLSWFKTLTNLSTIVANKFKVCKLPWGINRKICSFIKNSRHRDIARSKWLSRMHGNLHRNFPKAGYSVP